MQTTSPAASTPSTSVLTFAIYLSMLDGEPPFSGYAVQFRLRYEETLRNLTTLY